MDAKSAGTGESEQQFSLWGAIGDSFATIPANLKDLAGTFLDPMGLSIGDVSNTEAAAEEMEVSKTTFGSMSTLFGSRIAAFAYLLFVLLYFPCVAAIAAVYRETNMRWTLFAGFWTTFMAWMAAIIFYQAATFGNHPTTSFFWIAASVILFAFVVASLYTLGGKMIKIKQIATVEGKAEVRA